MESGIVTIHMTFNFVYNNDISLSFKKKNDQIYKLEVYDLGFFRSINFGMQIKRIELVLITHVTLFQFVDSVSTGKFLSLLEISNLCVLSVSAFASLTID